MRASHLLLVLACVSISGCSRIIGPQNCTLIGCNDGLEVVLDVAQTAPFRVEAELPGQSSRYVFDCTNRSQCSGRAFFADFTPDEVRIHVITESGTTTHLVRPVYSEHRPNGPDCPPRCRTARVDIPSTPGNPA